MRGRHEVARLKARLDATFGRVAGLPLDGELRADFARYLCVLVSGFLESAVTELAIECARKQAGPRIQSYVSAQLQYFQNPKAERLLQLVGSFDPAWAQTLNTFLEDQRRDAINSVVANRHLIAHGEIVGITYVRIREYYSAIVEVVAFLADLFDPAP